MREPREKQRSLLIIKLSDEGGHPYKELKKILKHGTRVSTLISELEDQGVVYNKPAKSPNPEIKHDRRTDPKYDYYIGPTSPATSQERLKVFKAIFRECVNNCEIDLQEKFLASKYVDNLIKYVGFISIYNIIKTYLPEEPFKKSASRALLNLPSVSKQYKNQLEIISYDDSYDDNIRHDTHNIIHDECLPYLVTDNLIKNDLIGILSSFDQLTAIGFYRRIINNGYSEIFKKFTSGFFKSEAINEFIDLDVYLSPFTSYPKNIPSDLLLKRPYERIYDDAYILSESDREKFIRRAYIVYMHFAEILFEACFKDMRLAELDLIDYQTTKMVDEYLLHIDDVLPEERIEYLRRYESRQDYLENIIYHIQITIKLAIYYWNIASLRFDIVNGYLNHKKPGKYHINSDNASIWITDLQSGERKPVASTDVLSSVKLLPGPRDPFASLWPCNAFKEFNLDTKTVTYNEILKFMKSNLKYWDAS